MKARTARCQARARKGRRECDLDREEMQSLLAKLKELVPNLPRSKKLSKLEIIQNVIDYILDLQIALETRSSHPVGSSANLARQPLGNLLPSIVNTCLPQEVGHADKVPANLANVMPTTLAPQYRSVSC